MATDGDNALALRQQPADLLHGHDKFLLRHGRADGKHLGIRLFADRQQQTAFSRRHDEALCQYAGIASELPLDLGLQFLGLRSGIRFGKFCLFGISLTGVGRLPIGL